MTDPATMARALAAGRGRRPARLAGDRGRADDRLHEVAQGGRADGALHACWSSSGAGHPGLASADRALPRGLHAAAAARARSGGWCPASCSAWSPPTRWSSGIDIGALDAAICVTFPGTVASLRQMWGRAGRRGRGLAVYVAGEDALDQFFCRHPDEFLERPVEAAILDHENEQLYAAHLLCAAHEAPLEPADDGGARAALARGRVGAGRRGRPARAPGRHVRPAPAGGVPGGRVLPAQRVARRRRDHQPRRPAR